MTTQYSERRYGVKEEPFTRLTFVAMVPLCALYAFAMHNAMMFILPALAACIMEYTRYKGAPALNAVKSAVTLFALFASVAFWWWPFHQGVYVVGSQIAPANKVSVLPIFHQTPAFIASPEGEQRIPIVAWTKDKHSVFIEAAATFSLSNSPQMLGSKKKMRLAERVGAAEDVISSGYQSVIGTMLAKEIKPGSGTEINSKAVEKTGGFSSLESRSGLTASGTTILAIQSPIKTD